MDTHGYDSDDGFPSERSERQQVFDRRPLTHQDELETRSDDLLYRLEDQFKNRISGCRYEDDRYRLEVDLCYVQRELGIRKTRLEYSEALRAREDVSSNGTVDAVGG